MNLRKLTLKLPTNTPYAPQRPQIPQLWAIKNPPNQNSKTSSTSKARRRVIPPRRHRLNRPKMTKKASTPQPNPRPSLRRRPKSRMLTTSQATKRRQTSRWAVRPLLSLKTAKMLRPKSESSSNRSRTQPKDGRPLKARAAAIKHHLWVVEPKSHRSPAQQSDNRRALPRQQVPT